jgi:hypothetical protein
MRLRILGSRHCEFGAADGSRVFYERMYALLAVEAFCEGEAMRAVEAFKAAEASSASSQTIWNWIRGEQQHAVRIGRHDAGRTEATIATYCAAAATITSAWKTSWKPNVRGQGSGRCVAYTIAPAE